MPYTPKHLKRWTRPDNYGGASWPDYYSSGFGRSRDSDCLEESNFAVAWETLGDLTTEAAPVEIVRERHWAIGWVEWIAIHQDNETALKAADEIRERAEAYPVLDEKDWSEREREAADTGL